MKRAAVMTLALVAGCAAVEAAGADATYAGQQTSCANRATSKAQSQACREEVNRRWCVVDGSPQCVPEGGTDQ